LNNLWNIYELKFKVKSFYIKISSKNRKYV